MKICSDCNGSGRCFPCGGTGSFDCVFCEGTGQKQDKEPCEGCNGTGIKKCDNCDGNGVCPDCDGNGLSKKIETETDLQRRIQKIKLISSSQSNSHLYKNLNEFPVRVVFYWYNKYYNFKSNSWNTLDGEISVDFDVNGIKVVTLPFNQKTVIRNVIVR